MINSLQAHATYLISKYGKSVANLSILVSLLYILVYYNDDGNLRDAGVYFDSGIAVLKGENPYVASRWGSFGPVPFSILLSVIPEGMRAIAVRILSLAGIYVFFRIFCPNKRLIEPFAISFIILWTSPVRELMVTNQMTGIAIGLLALGAKFLNPFTSFRDITKETLIGALFFAMALDLKPHICIFFFLSWVIYKKSFQKFLIVALTLFITHLTINLSQMRILEKDWFTALSGVNKSASQASLGDSVSFWPILNYFIDATSFLYFASILITCALAGVCFYSAFKGRWEEVLILSFFIPSTSIYYHYYDAVPLCVLLVVMLFRIGNPFLESFAISFILIPKEYMSFRNQVLVLLVVGFLTSRSMIVSKSKKKELIVGSTILGLAASTLLHLINTWLELSDHLLQSLIVTESLVIIMILYFYARARKISIV